MKKIFSFLFIILIVLVAVFNASAQLKKFGKKLKGAGNLVNVNKLVKKGIDKKDIRNDSVMFNYAISLSDNSTLFETRDFFQKNNQLLSDLFVDDSNLTPAEEAESFINYGENFYSANKFKSAEFTFHTARLIFEEAGDTINLDYFRTLADLGLLYHSSGRYNLAEEYTEMALQRRKKHMGEKSGGYAASLNNRGVLFNDMGKYNEAELIFNQSLYFNESSLGEESLGQAILLNNKAMLFQKVGRYAEAEELLRKSLKIASESIGESSGRYQKLMTNLALLLQDMGEKEEAELIYKEAIQLKKKRFGESHPDYAHMLMNLASLYVEMEKFEDVEELLNDAKAIFEKKLGIQSLEYASTLSNLGSYYLYTGKYEPALEQFLQAEKIRSVLLGESNPVYVKTIEDLAISHWKNGDIDKATTLFINSLDRSIDFIHTYFPPMSEQEKTLYWDKLHPSFQRFYSFVSENSKTHPELLSHAFNYRLATKALLLSSSSKIRNQILNSGDQNLINDYLAWVDHKEMLSRLYSYSNEDLREEKINLDSLEDVTNSLERSLSSKSNAFSEVSHLTEYKYNDVVEKLKDNEAVVEIIHFMQFDNAFTGNSKYLILIGSNLQNNNPKGVVLDKGTELETRYLKYYQNSIKQKVEDEYSFDQFWKAVQNEIAGYEKIYLSPDGVYNQINVATLRKDDGTYVIDNLNLVLIGNAREVIEITENEDEIINLTSANKAYIIGFPDYGNDAELVPLPGTKLEAERVSAILKKNEVTSQIYLQDGAKEENIKEIIDPDILHFATHGFFLEDINNLKSEKVFGIQIDKAKDNPLLRSGLFFSGAANSKDKDKDSELISKDDGILTAYEAMNLPLDKTKLVILSACETGLGNIKSGEGVYGLQRAFLVAGSKAVIMSLWKVNDETTQQLMVLFYEHWMESGSKIQAFKKAQLSLKYKYSDPYFWGAFVMIGV